MSRPAPLLPRRPGDRVRAADWERLQVALAERLQRHDHADAPVPTKAFAPTARLRARRLRAGSALLRGQPLAARLEEAVMDPAACEALIAGRLDQAGGVLEGSLTVTGALEVGGDLVVDGDLILPPSKGAMGAGALRLSASAGAMSLSAQGVTVMQLPFTLGELGLVSVWVQLEEGEAPGATSYCVGWRRFVLIPYRDNGIGGPVDMATAAQLAAQGWSIRKDEWTEYSRQWEDDRQTETGEWEYQKIARGYVYSEPIYETIAPPPPPPGLAATLTLSLSAQRISAGAPIDPAIAAWNAVQHAAILWERDGVPLAGGRALQQTLLLPAGSWNLVVTGTGTRRPLRAARLELLALPLGEAP